MDFVNEGRPDARADAFATTLNVWDCGGQDEYHVVHQLLPSSFAVYCFVVSLGVSDDEQKRASLEWLRVLRLRLGEDGVLLVLAQSDRVPQGSIIRFRDHFSDFLPPPLTNVNSIVLLTTTPIPNSLLLSAPFYLPFPFLST